MSDRAADDRARGLCDLCHMPAPGQGLAYPNNTPGWIPRHVQCPRDPVGNRLVLSRDASECPYPCKMTLPHPHSIIPVTGVCPPCTQAARKADDG